MKKLKKIQFKNPVGMPTGAPVTYIDMKHQPIEGVIDDIDAHLFISGEKRSIPRTNVLWYSSEALPEPEDFIEEEEDEEPKLVGPGA